MPTFEQGFADAEKAADSTIKSAADLARLAKALQKAAKEGNIAAIKREASRLDDALGSLRQEVANAIETWPFHDEEEEEYLREHYAAELRDVAAEKGLEIYERDGVLISHPSIVRILPGSRAVRIDKKQVSALRPSHLAGTLANNQKKPRRFRSEAFLEALYKAYQPFAREQTSSRLIKDPVVPLSSIYDVFTSLPGSNREYDSTDFARDLYFLELEGTLTTRSGARASFPSSTGARRARGSFPFVGPNGQVITYYGIQFSEG
jgi:hypothetical protein